MTTIAEALIDEGRVEGKLDPIRHTLAYRFGQPLDRFDESLRSLSLNALTRLGDVVYEVIDLPS